MSARRWMRARIAVVAMALLVSTPWSRAEEIFRRAETLEEIVGRVELRAAYGDRLTVVVECEERREGCTAERRYGDLIQLDFFLRTQEYRDGFVTSHEDDAGSILLAADFDEAEGRAFLTELTDTLISLPATAFEQSLAGLGPARPPFDKETLSPRSAQPTWVCLTVDGITKAVRFHRRSDGSEVRGIGAKFYDIPPTPVCEEIAAATRPVAPQSYWTLSTPRRLLEHVVEYDDLDNLSPDPAFLAPRPEGVELVKQRFDSGGSIDSASVDEGGLSRGTRTAGGWRFDAWGPPAAMPIAALDEDAWLQTWTVRSVEREFGADPRTRVLAESTTHVAFLPTVPASTLAEPSPDGSYQVSSSGRLVSEVVPAPAVEPPRIDQAGFVEQVLGELESQSGDPGESIDRFLRRPGATLVSDGWIVVVCGPDQSAEYVLPPTRVRNRVTNAELFCAALESRLH